MPISGNEKDWAREAADPTTPSTRLEEILIGGLRISEEGAEFVLRRYSEFAMALAGNPNLPPSVVPHLLACVPANMLQNPILPFLTLENPGLLEKMVRTDALPLLRNDALPSSLIAALAAHPDPSVAREARGHIALAGEADPARTDWRGEIEAVLDTLPAPPADQLAEYCEEGLASSYLIGWLRRQGQDPEDIPPPELPESIQRIEEKRLKLLEALPTAPVDAQGLEKLSTKEQAALAVHPDTSPELLLRLAKRESFAVRRAVAQNPVATVEMLDAAWKADSVPWVAAHPNTPPEMLRKIERAHKRAEVQAVLATNPNLPPELLRLMVQRRPPYIRRLARRHPFLTPGLLAQSRSYLVKELLTQRGEGSLLLWFDLAAHKKLHAAHLAQFIASDYSLVRLAVALNPFTTPKQLAPLLQDKNRLVRVAALSRCAK